MKQLLHEPLVHFLAIGSLLFVAYGLKPIPPAQQAKQILVLQTDIERLSAHFARTWMRPPTAAELDGLVEAHVRDEVYYREALALGLDRDDPMVRQRMRQKLGFLLEDLSDAGEPSVVELTHFLTENPERFTEPARISFQQVYLSPDRHVDLDAATTALAEALEAGVAVAGLGDQTMLGQVFASATPQEIARLFGAAFAERVVALEPGAWHGPVDSGFGRHFVRITDRQAEYLPTLDAVRDRVAAEWRAQRERERKEAAYQRLREGYEVIIEGMSQASVPSLPRPRGNGG